MFHAQAPGNSANVVEGRMGPAVYLGDRSHFHVRVSGREQPVAVALQNQETTAVHQVPTDQPVWLSFKDQAVVLLRSG